MSPTRRRRADDDGADSLLVRKAGEFASWVPARSGESPLNLPPDQELNDHRKHEDSCRLTLSEVAYLRNSILCMPVRVRSNVHDEQRSAGSGREFGCVS
jgi:hypothetical protein